MFRVVINRIGRRDEPLCGRRLFPGIQVAIEAREIAAGDFQAQHVAFVEDIAGGPEVEIEFVDLAWVQELGFLGGIAVARADNSFSQVLREAIGPDIDQFGGEVGVDRGGFRIELQRDGAGDFDVLREWRGGINQNIIARFRRTSDRVGPA